MKKKQKTFCCFNHDFDIELRSTRQIRYES